MSYQRLHLDPCIELNPMWFIYIIIDKSMLYMCLTDSVKRFYSSLVKSLKERQYVILYFMMCCFVMMCPPRPGVSINLFFS